MDNENKRGFSPEEEERMRERARENAKKREAQQRKREEQQALKKKKMNRVSTVGIIVLIAVVAFSLLFIAARSLGNVTFTKIIDYIKDGFSNLEAGEGYPLEIGSGSVQDMLMLGDSTVVIKNDELALYNRTAKKVAAQTHSYSKPMTSVQQSRILFCDRVTGRYMIIDRSDKLREEELQSETYACTLAENGSYAFSIRTDGAASMVSYYSSSFKKVFDFKCADEYIIGLSISPNGKQLAMIGVGSKDACIYSKLYIINIKNQEVINSFDFDGESLHTVLYSDNNNIIVVGENAYTVIKNNSEKEKINFGYNTISRCSSVKDGKFAVVLSKYGSIDSGTVALLNSKGEELFSVELESKIECIDYDGSTVCVVDSDHYVHTFNKRGKLIGKTKLDTAAQDVAVSGNKCYALCFGTVVQIDVRNSKDG